MSGAVHFHVLGLLATSAWQGPLTQPHFPTCGAIGRSSLMNTLTVGSQAREASQSPPPDLSTFESDEQATKPTMLHAASLVATGMQLWPPVAAALAACLLLLRRVHQPSALLTALLRIEAVHYLYARVASRARGRSHTRPDPSGQVQLELWRKCLDEDTTISASEFIRGWFLKSSHQHHEGGGTGTAAVVRLHELHRDNVAEFIAYAVHSARVDELETTRRAELEACVCMVEERIAREEGLPGFRFEAGYNSALSAMTLNLDAPSATMQPRPLLYYLLTDVLASAVTGAVMRARGFRRYREGKLTYWHHPGGDACAAGPSSTVSSSADKAPPPLVFVHGVGLGLTPYLGLLRELRELRGGGSQLGTRPPMLVLELPFVSQRLAGLRSLPQERRTTDEIARAMARHRLRPATFVGHSLGTVYLSWVAKLRPELLASCVFIDPIVFLLHQRKVAHAFIYDKPARNDPQGRVETFFVKSERSTATYFHRHFYWFSNILFANELTAPSAVVLAADDSIVPVQNVAAYLRAQGDEQANSSGAPAVRQVVTLEGKVHGQFLVDAEARARVLSAVVDAQAWAQRDEASSSRVHAAI